MKKSKGVKGESSYDSSSRKVKKFDNKPLTPAIYEEKFIAGTAEIAKAAGNGKVPYVRGKFELLNTASKKGGKNRTMYHNFFLTLTPGSDGVAQVDRGDGITAYAQALGIKLKVPTQVVNKVDDEGNKSKVTILDPAAVVKFLEKTAGRVHSVKTKNEKSQKDDSLWPRVEFFAAAKDDEGEEEEEDEDDDEEGSEDEEESDEDEDEDEDSDDSDDEDEDDDDEEEEDDEDSDDDDDDESDDDEDEDSDDEDDDEDEDEEEDEEEDDEEPVKKKGKKKPAPKKKGKGKK